METINDRFKQLRKECHKTQDEFAEIFGMTRSGICDIEKGRNKVTEKHLLMLSNWKEHKVNIEWLRTGEGGPDNMFLHPEENDLIAKANALFGEKDPLFEALIVTYSKLVPKNKEVLLNFFKDFSETLAKRNLTSENNSQTVVTPEPFFTNDNITEPESLKTILNSFPSKNLFDINERKAVDTMRKALDDDHEDSSTQTG